MPYRVVFRARVWRDAGRLAPAVQGRVRRRTDALAVDPRPSDCLKLAGAEDLWRIRVGAYRVVYSIDDAARVVTVTRIGHRSEVYR